MGIFTCLGKKLNLFTKNLKSQAPKKITGITQATQEITKRHEGFCAITLPAKDTASKLHHCQLHSQTDSCGRKGSTWIRSGQGPLSPCCKAHTTSQCPDSEENLDEADLWLRFRNLLPSLSHPLCSHTSSVSHHRSSIEMQSHISWCQDHHSLPWNTPRLLSPH